MGSGAISGTFADLRSVKSRGVVVMHVEVPIEMAEHIVALFGYPQPGKEQHVAIAPLREEPKAEKPANDRADGKPRKRFDDMPRSQQAGVLCADPRFREWLSEGQQLTEEQAAALVRKECCVTSRTYLNLAGEAKRRWDHIVAEYRAATGQQAEARG